MKTELHLLSFANINLKHLPKKTPLEYQVIGEDGSYRIVSAPIVLKNKEALTSLYYDFDKLSEEEQLFYQSVMMTYTKKEDGTYKLETRIYEKYKKRQQLNNLV